jgi:hypothetical protein
MMSFRSYSSLLRILFISQITLLVGCGKVFYTTQLSEQQKASICASSVSWDRQECLLEANEQMEWCKEQIGQEDDCWNTLLGDYSRFRHELQVTDHDYFEILKDPVKVRPLVEQLRSNHPSI